MDTPLNPMTNGIFSDLLETQTRLRDEAELKWFQARKFIQAIAVQVANDWLDEQQRVAGLELERIGLDRLTPVIQERISRLLSQRPGQASASDAALRQRYENLLESQRQAEMNIGQLQIEKDGLEQSIRRLKAQIQKSEQEALAQTGHPFQPDPATLPDFYLAWTQERFFERQAFILQQMGETGLARAPKLKEKIIERFNLGERSNSADMVLEGLLSQGFVTDYGTTGGLTGSPPDIIELTPLGQAAFLFLTGKKPVISEYAIKKDHKTDAHTRLILMAQDWLKLAGYQILEHAPVIEMDEQHVFNPDMMARRGENLIYIEVERNSHKTNQDREAKWRNFFHYTKGHLFFFCENEKAQRELIREMNVALGSSLEQARGAICDLSKMNAGILQSTGDVWTSVRGKGR